MKPSLQFRLSQHLALTPQLQQSIRLLQLSTLELHQEVEQMLEQNPFLEPEEERGSFEDQILADRATLRPLIDAKAAAYAKEKGITLPDRPRMGPRPMQRPHPHEATPRPQG